MAIISTTQLYSLLQEKVGKETAESLTRFIEEKVKAEIESKKELLATKEDIYDVKTGLIQMISESKVDTIKWMFIFWIGQIAATFGFILLFLKR